MNVVHERHAGAACGDAAHQRGARRVRVDQVVVVELDEPRDLLRDAEVEPAAHRHLDERGVLRFPRGREAARLDAHEADFAAQPRQLAGQQILHALGAGIVLAVHQVQHADRPRRRGHDWRGGRRRGGWHRDGGRRERERFWFENGCGHGQRRRQKIDRIGNPFGRGAGRTSSFLRGPAAPISTVPCAAARHASGAAGGAACGGCDGGAEAECRILALRSELDFSFQNSSFWNRRNAVRSAISADVAMACSKIGAFVG